MRQTTCAIIKMAYNRKRSSEDEEDHYLSLPRPKMFRSEEEGDEYEEHQAGSNSDDATSSTDNSSSSSDEVYSSKMRIALGNSPVHVKKPEAKYSDFSQRMMVC